MEVIPMEKDPLTIIREKLWEVVDSSEFFRTWIRESNRIRFDTELGTKEHAGHGDLPEVIIVPSSSSQLDMGTSGTARLSMSFLFYLSTGSKNLQMISALQWELFRVIQTFMANVGNCLYHGNRFVERIRFDSGEQAISDAERNRGIGGWSASWGVTVDMFFPHSEVIFNIQDKE